MTVPPPRPPEPTPPSGSEPHFEAFGAGGMQNPPDVPAQPFRIQAVEGERALEPWQLRTAFALLILTAGSILGWSVSSAGLGDTGFYFIAIPGLLAAAAALLPSRGRTDSAVRTMRTSLMIVFGSAIVIREGVICMIMASPLVLLVVGIVVHADARKHRHLGAQLALPLLLLFGSFEGVAFDLDSRAEVTAARVVALDGDEVDASLASPGSLPAIRPLLFRLPFPQPTSIESEGGAVGDRQRVEFDGGRIELVVEDRTDRSIRWRVAGDSTPIAGWYDLDTIELQWSEVADGSRVEVSIAYDRRLAPAVYFDPLGRFGVGELAEVVIDTVEASG